jgi:hypothetical protein
MQLEEAYAEEAAALGSRVRSILSLTGSGLSRNVAVDQHPENLLLAIVCSSICYEYASYPSLSLALSDIPHAKFIVQRSCTQLFSLFQGPNKTLFLALPGTHDLRTVLTDAQVSRVVETQMSECIGGYTESGRALNCGVATLWEYKVHSGFLNEEMKLRTELSTAALKVYIGLGFNIVVCGHSLGGALAVLTTLRLLSDDLAAFQGRLSCVTIGAPWVGNSALTRKVQRCGWEKYFHHLVYRADIVPRVMCASAIPKEVVQQLQDHVSTTVQSVQSTLQSFFGRPRSLSDAVAEMSAAESNGGDAQPTGGKDKAAAVTMSALLHGERRHFDTFGHFYFLYRGEDASSPSPVARTVVPQESFAVLRRKPSCSSQIQDHLIDSYNRAVAQLLR